MKPLLARGMVRLKHSLGVDGAVGYTALARVCSIVSSVGTVLLLVRFLSPVEQGYYYTLLSLVLLQSVFELGFSFVIQQYAAHESVLCVIFRDGHIEGDETAHSRLASVLQLAARWYLGASIAIAVVLLPLGFAFFSRRSEAHGHVAWQGPWVAVVLATAASFLVAPIYSFLDGCGQIKQVAKARFYQAVVVLAAAWGTMACGRGLYAPAMVNASIVCVAIFFLAPRRRLLTGLMRHSSQHGSVSWRYEIWPFQWKIAISWFCTYFITQLFTPVLFVARGPVEAGRMGMSINIVAYLPILVLSWISTKATPFGQLIKLGRLEELDRLFFRTFRQSLTLLAVLIAGCLAGVIAVRHLFPHLAGRMETPTIFAFLLATAGGTFAVQSMAIYLRSFKEEPFLTQSTVVALLTAAGVMVSASRWGGYGVALSYFLSSGVVGLATAMWIFRGKRRLQRSAAAKSKAKHLTVRQANPDDSRAARISEQAVEGA